MEQNIHDVHNVAEYASANGMEVFYQAVEQNYNTEEDRRWFEHSDNWPKNPSRAVDAVQRLIALKRNGLPIRNSYRQLQTMIPYFLNPDAIRVSVQQHTAHLKYPVCAALTNIQIQPNGYVLACYGTPPIGNIRTASIREIWRNRPQLWKGGCCLERRLSPAEAETRGLVLIGATGGQSLDRRS
jgi:MoaA/NifB/PqqE/SkfB family radical SAM enzyme